MSVELYKDEKLMRGVPQAARARARNRPPVGGTYRLLCPNPQSLRALMTARHDPPGKILGDHGAGDIKYAARVESTVMSRAAAEGERVEYPFTAHGLSSGMIAPDLGGFS